MKPVIISQEQAQLFLSLLAQARDSAKLQKAVDTSYLECINHINSLREEKEVALLFEVDQNQMKSSRVGLGVFGSTELAEQHAKENGYNDTDNWFDIVEVVFNQFQEY